MLAFATQEWSAFWKCYAARRSLDPSAASSVVSRGMQASLDLCFCSRSNAFMATFLLAVVIGVVAYILSKITKSDSWIDRGWSVFPGIHVYLMTVLPNSTDAVAGAATAGTTWSTLTAKQLFAYIVYLWCIRLTFNFWRRGGYTSEGEDYRWEWVRSWPSMKNKALYEVFSFGFISMYQALLLWAQTLPLLALPSHAAGPAQPVHWIVAGFFLVFLLGETIADEQQWIFQQGKRKLGPRFAHLANDYSRGFLTKGLFAVSRHPNVFCEQAMWVMIYMVSIQQWGLLNLSIVGCLALIQLTFTSCAFVTETITVGKYPSYRQYQEKTNVLLPTRVGVSL